MLDTRLSGTKKAQDSEQDTVDTGMVLTWKVRYIHCLHLLKTPTMGAIAVTIVQMSELRPREVK